MTETGAQLFARLESRRSLRDVEPRLFPENVGPENGEVVELFGPEGSGKSELLYLLVCRCVLPRSAGGLELSVVFVDTDFSLDLLRLVTILDHKLQHTTAPCGAGGPDEALLRSCLSRVLVLHCSSSSQLLLTLHFLETSLAARPDLSLLLIDSISAFYWLDRAEGGASYAKQEEKLNRCSELLGRLLRDYKITVFASCHSIRQHSSSVSSSAPSSSSALSALFPLLLHLPLHPPLPLLLHLPLHPPLPLLLLLPLVLLLLHLSLLLHPPPLLLPRLWTRTDRTCAGRGRSLCRTV